MTKIEQDVVNQVKNVVYTIEQALWDNKLMTWNGDELMTEEINNVFLNAAMEN